MSPNPQNQIDKKLEIIPLGGQGEIGKNMICLRYEDEILIIDAGMKFPEADMYGVNMVIPDMSYIFKNKDLVKGIVLTHGHEDHIGALPYLRKEVNAPIYGTALTLGLAEEKLREHGLLKTSKLNVIKPTDSITVGPFTVEFMRVCHSIADGVALAVRVGGMLFVHSGDFKIDHTPVDGEATDLNKFGALGTEGVDVFMSDSTNADIPGITPTEKSVGESFENIFRGAKGRIIVASFASNIHRIQQVINTAEKFGRKVAVSGRSMHIVTTKAKQLGRLSYPDDILVSLENINNIPANKIVIITTGSQGEPMSALTRMSVGEHKHVNIKKGDTVVISAIPIPGNEKLIDKTIDNLYRRGAEVIHEQRFAIHVSGHAAQEELKLVLNLVKPKFFIPIHGEYRHMVYHAKLAEEIGVVKKNIILPENGDVIEYKGDKITIKDKVAEEAIMVDRVGEIEYSTIKERKQLSQEGVVLVSIVVSSKDNSLKKGPEILTRGFIYIEEANHIMEGINKTVEDILAGNIKSKDEIKALSISSLKSLIKEKLDKLVNKQTRRRPALIVSILEV